MCGDLHICIGTGRFFMARSRMPFQRRMSWRGPKRKQLKHALLDMARHWGNSSGLQEADVIMCADYYDPARIVVLRRDS